MNPDEFLDWVLAQIKKCKKKQLSTKDQTDIYLYAGMIRAFESVMTKCLTTKSEDKK